MRQQSHSWVGTYPEKGKNSNLQRHMHHNVHINFIYNSLDMEMTQIPINRQLAWEDVVYLYNGILLIHKKKNIAICSNVDGLRDYQAAWSKSYRERQVLCHLYTESKK